MNSKIIHSANYYKTHTKANVQNGIEIIHKGIRRHINPH